MFCKVSGKIFLYKCLLYIVVFSKKKKKVVEILLVKRIFFFLYTQKERFQGNNINKQIYFISLRTKCLLI